MTNTTEKEITIIDAVPEHWGDRKEVAAVGRRIKALLPGGQNMTDVQAMALAQYARLVDANPFRGEIYMLPSGQIVDGYKLLVRWARDRAKFTEKYNELSETDKVSEGVSDDDIAYKCSVLRDDRKNMLMTFVQAGATFQEAYDLAATTAIGVVTVKDRSGRNGGEIPPPKGWTWAQVARKRALKNALNISHGAPSPRELAQASWQVGPTRTQAEDWQEIPADLPPEARDRAARFAAIGREVLEAGKTLTPEEKIARRQDNDKLLYPDRDEILDEGYDDYDERPGDAPHWSDNPKNRMGIEALLMRKNIPLEILFQVCDVGSWSDMPKFKGTGQEAFYAASAYWLDGAPTTPDEAASPKDAVEPEATDEIPF